jgi:hypothetical protein
MAGSGPYQFVWQRDGVALENGPTPHGSVISGSQTMRLQITGCSELDEGQYQLVVTNSCGTGQSATVAVSLCRADANCDGVVDFFDYLDFVQLFAAGSSQADFNQDQILNLFDYLEFVASFASGC